MKLNRAQRKECEELIESLVTPSALIKQLCRIANQHGPIAVAFKAILHLYGEDAVEAALLALTMPIEKLPPPDLALRDAIVSSKAPFRPTLELILSTKSFDGTRPPGLREHVRAMDLANSIYHLFDDKAVLTHVAPNQRVLIIMLIKKWFEYLEMLSVPRERTKKEPPHKKEILHQALLDDGDKLVELFNETIEGGPEPIVCKQKEPTQ